MIMTNNYYDALAQLRDEEMKEEVMNRMAEENMQKECLMEEHLAQVPKRKLSLLFCAYRIPVIPILIGLTEL